MKGNSEYPEAGWLPVSSLDTMPSRQRAHLVNLLSGVKGLHLLGSRSADGHDNLAVFNSVIHVGASPAAMGVLFRPITVRRDSWRNIQETGEFTLNLVTRGMLDAAHDTSAKWPEDVSEFAATGLTPVKGDAISAPYVAESPIRIGLRHVETHTIEINDTQLVIGQVEEIWLPEPIQRAGWMPLDELNLVSVAGLDTYYAPQWLVRKGYAEPGTPTGDLSTPEFRQR